MGANGEMARLAQNLITHGLTNALWAGRVIQNHHPPLQLRVSSILSFFRRWCKLSAKMLRVRFSPKRVLSLDSLRLIKSSLGSTLSSDCRYGQPKSLVSFAPAPPPALIGVTAVVRGDDRRTAELVAQLALRTQLVFLLCTTLSLIEKNRSTLARETRVRLQTMLTNDLQVQTQKCHALHQRIEMRRTAVAATFRVL